MFSKIFGPVSHSIDKYAPVFQSRKTNEVEAQKMIWRRFIQEAVDIYISDYIHIKNAKFELNLVLQITCFGFAMMERIIKDLIYEAGGSDGEILRWDIEVRLETNEIVYVSFKMIEVT